MKRIATALGGLCMLLAMFPSFAAAQDQKPEIAKTNLKVGDVAPDFTLLSDKWEPVKLSDYRGKKTVILAFYVLAFTGG
jgi:peroxiredoxin